MNAVKPFDRCTETKLIQNGSMEIHCKRGLWYVLGRDHKRVKLEALNYWVQYLRDGEYDEILEIKT